jgi:hypothetical protein
MPSTIFPLEPVRLAEIFVKDFALENMHSSLIVGQVLFCILTF